MSEEERKAWGVTSQKCKAQEPLSTHTAYPEHTGNNHIPCVVEIGPGKMNNMGEFVVEIQKNIPKYGFPPTELHQIFKEKVEILKLF